MKLSNRALVLLNWLCLALCFGATRTSGEMLLETLPVRANGGFRMEGYWVWDPSVVKAPDGKWHFFASRWPHSKPTHLLGAVADGPGGFTRASQTWDMVIPLKTAP